MFKLEPNPTFWAKVMIPVPGDEPVPIEIEFRHFSRKKLAEMMEADAEKNIGISFCEQIITDWRDVEDEFSRDELERLLDNYHGAGLAIFLAYHKELQQGRQKN
jgi:hypothetical protein